MLFSKADIQVAAAALLMLIPAYSCRKEKPEEAYGMRMSDVRITFSIDNGNVAGTKADPEIEGGHNTGIDENGIHALAVYVIPLTAEDEEQWEECRMFYTNTPERYLATPGDPHGESNPYTAEIQATSGPQHIYVAANLNPSAASHFLNNRNAKYSEQSSGNYISDIGKWASEDGGIAMFCDSPSKITVEDRHLSGSEEIKIGSVALERLVAKVHVTFDCHSDETDASDDYAIITLPGSDNKENYVGEAGWVPMSSVTYILNSTNNETYLYGENDTDPNHEIGPLIEKVGEDWDYRTESSKVFTSFTGGYLEDEFDRWSCVAEKFDGSRKPFGDGSRYLSGLYCLENTVGGLSDELKAQMTDDEMENVPLKVTTHIIVKARFIPRQIYGDGLVLKDFNSSKSGSVAGLQEAVEWLRSESENGTADYYTPDMEHFYSYKGMIAKKLQDPGMIFAKYEDGYGFYTTYIDGIKTDGSGNPTDAAATLQFSEKSSVKRNNYHILRCSLLKVPAVPGTFNQTMRVNAYTAEWNSTVRQTVVIKP